MSLYADYVKTFDIHVASFTHLVDQSSEATIVSKKLTISTFSHTKAYATKSDLDVNGSRSSQSSFE